MLSPAALIATVTTSTLPGLMDLLAQTTGPTTARTTATGGPPWYANPMVLPILLLVLFYIFMISSRRKQERQKREQMENIKRGDRVQTIGGILGSVVQTETDKVLLKVDESSNTKIWFARSAIHRVLDRGEKAVEATK